MTLQLLTEFYLSDTFLNNFVGRIETGYVMHPSQVDRVTVKTKKQKQKN